MVAHYFLGANSGGGFRDLFTGFCAPEKFEDLVILKGGPGSGKSTLMARLGAAMEAREQDVVYFHCSGDPDSLDGVYIPGARAAFLDGTAPHVLEPRYPAAVDRYVDLGRYYRVDRLKALREEVVSCTDACSAAYARAYRLLSAARQVELESRSLAAEGFSRDKLLRRTEGLISRELRGRGAGGAQDTFFLGSMTCRGPHWRFDTVEALCPRVCQLQDSWGLAAPMLERLRQAAQEKGFPCVSCPDPEDPRQLHHLLLPQQGLAFVTGREGMMYSGPEAGLNCAGSPSGRAQKKKRHSHGCRRSISVPFSCCTPWGSRSCGSRG